MLQSLSDFISKVTRGEKVRIGDSEAQWKKVSELTPGMMVAVPKSLPDDFAPLPNLSDVESKSLPKAESTIAEAGVAEIDNSDVLWDEIVSIKKLTPERVYDIEVEGTHNFVAGNFVDTPLKDKNNSGSGTEKWYGAFFAHNTYISGNVGIGTTSPVARLDIVGSQNFTAFTAPGALTAGTPTAGGSCTAGTHSYAVTFTSVGSGETTAGTASNIITCVLTSGQTVPLSAIPTGPAGTLSRKIYRTVAGNTGSYLLLTTIADNTTTTFSDTVADASLGAAAPVSNTTAVANLQTGGTTRMVIDNSGNVGIGTAGPGAKLDIVGTDAAQADGNAMLQVRGTGVKLQLGAYETGGYTWIQSMKSGIGYNTLALNPTGGNVGIGTTSPSNKLAVYSTTSAAGITLDGTTNPALTMNASGATKGYFATTTSAGSWFSDSAVNDLIIRSEAANILLGQGSGGTTLAINAGNVGIGTTQPTAGKLVVKSGVANAPILEIGSSTLIDSYSIGIRASGGLNNSYLNLMSSTGNVRLYDTSNNYTFYAYNGGTIGAQIAAGGTSFLNGGNVGIGTTSPAAKLDLAGSLKVTGGNAITLQTSSGDVSINPGSGNISLNSGNITNLGQVTGDLIVSGKIYPGQTASGGKQSSLFIVSDTSNNQILTNAASGWSTGGTDFAEVFGTLGALQTGDVVEISGATTISQNTPQVDRTKTAYSDKVLGVVTDRPGFVGGRSINDTNLEGRIVGLLGRVPTKVSTVNGPIRLGDPLTTSSIPGFAMKATKPGQIVGRALQDFSCDSSDNSSCQGQILAFVQPSWYDPDLKLTDTGDLSITQSSKAENSIAGAVGESPGYDLKLNSEIINRVGAFSEAAVANLKSGLIAAGQIVGNTAHLASAQIDKLTTDNLQLTTKLVSPLIETGDLVATGTARLHEVQTNLISPLGNDLTIQLSTGSGEVAPGKFQISDENGNTTSSIDATGNAAFAGELKASSLKLTSAQSPLGRTFGVNPLLPGEGRGEVPPALDVQGNATVSGTLFANDLVTKEGKFSDLLKQSTPSATYVTNNVYNITQIATPSATVIPTPAVEPTTYNQPARNASHSDAGGQPTTTPNPTPINLMPSVSPAPPDHPNMKESAATISANLNDLLNQILYPPTASVSGQLSLPDSTATISALLADQSQWPMANPAGYTPVYQNLPIINDETTMRILKNTSLSENLTVFGRSSLADTLIAGTLSVGGNLFIEDSSVQAVGKPLYLTSTEGIDILGGKVVIDTKGNLTTRGELVALGGVTTNEISPNNGNLTINLAQKNPISNITNQNNPSGRVGGGFGKLLLKGINSNEVASIDATGNASFAGTLAAQNLSLPSDQSATSSSVIIAAADNFSQNGIYAPAIKTNASTGIGVIPAGRTELVVYNPKITDKSLVYLTPVSPTENKVLFVTSKKAATTSPPQDGYFRVALDTPLSQEVKFNWWVINANGP